MLQCKMREAAVDIQVDREVCGRGGKEGLKIEQHDVLVDVVYSR